ncbi:uncharacterized protein BROUX77_006207 [Berkeleyomyces rouxiae]|uniref:uncharacterized protein n=1 Tax=Berkeleyomyces rouxiae TaxID=2035830 RepID=UPI003B80182B
MNDKSEDVLSGLPRDSQQEQPTNTPGLEVFTPQQLAIVQMILQNHAKLQAPAPPAPALALPPSQPMINHRYNAPWPEWDGKLLSFPRYFKQLKVRAQIAAHVIGSSQAICLSIFMSIHAEQQARVEQWFTDGAIHNWDWKSFLQHINDQFEDKDAIQKAGQKLCAIQMGSHQSFVSFLQDFEHQVGLCGGLDWPDRVKILHLNSAINSTLQVYLTVKNLPNDDYPRWVEKVKRVAGRVEALPGYSSKDPSKTLTWYSQTKAETMSAKVVTPSVVDQQPHPDNDEEHVTMSVNAFHTPLPSNECQRTRPVKPRAPWRSADEKEKAKSGNACFRCLATGHRSLDCPKFAPSRRPARMNHAMIPEVSEPMDEIIESVPHDADTRVDPDEFRPLSLKKRRRKKRTGTNIVHADAVNHMHSTPFLIETFVNNFFYCDALLDTGCLVTSAFDEGLVKRRGLQRIPVKRRELLLAENDTKKRWISEIAVCDIDIDGRKERVYGYVIPNLAYDMILGKPWMEKNDVVYSAKERMITFKDQGDRLIVREKGWREAHAGAPKASMVMAAVFAAEIRRGRKSKQKLQVFSASIQDINKALEVKARLTREQISERLPQELKHLAPIFLDDGEGDLPPNRPGIDHAIKMKKDEQGRDKEVPWGPLYNMSRDELLVLRKTLADHLDKGWIRASSSPGGAPVLFVRKPGGGLRFCVDYRALNDITEKDRYPLPLISETLRALAKARYFTKVDVRAAFHKIRITEGDEWKTAFRTSTLRDYLDDFCSAYLDDVLIYTDGSHKDHMRKVNLVLERLGDAGLRLDLNKCEFAVTETKYLGFIIQAGEGIKVDPAKVAAIREWQPPTNVKSVRSFLGFANFYRQFIPLFSEVAAPLVRLTKKEEPWKWSKTENQAFEKLKNDFMRAPVLAMWDEERPTIVECDCSGWALGGTLSQVDETGSLRPVAFFSKKLSPAEVNYEIHDKELLAVIKCLEEWRGELKSLGAPFKILTDHRNLQYFMTTRKLSERQVRWSQTLSEYDFQLEFRAGVKNGKPDALSRREQDTPQGEDDERLKSRIMKLVKDHWLPEATTVALSPAEIVQRTDIVPHGDQIFSQQDLQRLWDEAKTKDSDFHEMYKALATAERSFPPTLTKKVAISIAECEFDNRGALVYRQKLFIPDWEPLRTALIQSTHDSHVTGHPGRDGTLAILSRDFFWPGISRDTDGATERMNQEVLAYMRAFVTYSQYDWPELLPAAMLAINNRNTSMGVSPFFLTHGYHVDTIEQVQPEESPKTLEQQDAERFVERFREGWELAQAAMASRQQEMENQANKSRSSQERFEVGDLVWLKLKNISTPQISKKMSWVNAKYRVTKVVSPHVVELDVPTNIYPKFHVDLIKRAAGNPLPSQKTDDTQPPALEENEYGEPEYLVERILRSRRRRVGRGYRREVLVKWAGYAEPDWRPRADFEETEALETFEAEFGDEDDVGEPQTGAMTGPRTRMRGGG